MLGIPETYHSLGLDETHLIAHASNQLAFTCPNSLHSSSYPVDMRRIPTVHHSLCPANTTSFPCCGIANTCQLAERNFLSSTDCGVVEAGETLPPQHTRPAYDSWSYTIITCDDLFHGGCFFTQLTLRHFK